ncbi:MAG: sigma-54-dependent transcriptional regulator [Burkholderiaceae bacterium]
MAYSDAPVMIVEDDADLREALCATLDLQDVEYRAFDSAESALAAIDQEVYSMVLTDFRLPGMDGMTLLRSVHKKLPELPMVMMTAFAEAQLAVEALKAGARDFLIKPCQPEHLVEVIGRYRQAGGAGVGSAGTAAGATTGGNGKNGGQLIAESPAIQTILSRCTRVASTDATVLLTGESGVGKDVFAREVHKRSPRAAKPYVAINCAAIPETLLESILFGYERGAFTGAVKQQEGKFEQANGGTIFLDEIGEMPLELQAKLLRVLQDKVVERIGANKSVEIDLRIIAATNRDLPARVASGQFREDLYYRLAVFPIAIPPLRERVEDLLPLARYFVTKYGATMGHAKASLSQAAAERIVGYSWPGNVRELENAIQRALLLSDSGVIGPAELELGEIGAASMPAVSPATVAPGAAATGVAAPTQAPSGQGVAAPAASNTQPAAIAESGPDLASVSNKNLAEVERDHILKVLQQTDGNRRKAIEILGISERALRYKLKEYKEQGFLSE